MLAALSRKRTHPQRHEKLPEFRRREDRCVADLVMARHAPQDHVAHLGYQFVAGHLTDVRHRPSVLGPRSKAPT